MDARHSASWPKLDELQQFAHERADLDGMAKPPPGPK